MSYMDENEPFLSQNVVRPRPKPPTIPPPAEGFGDGAWSSAMLTAGQEPHPLGATPARDRGSAGSRAGGGYAADRNVPRAPWAVGGDGGRLPDQTHDAGTARRGPTSYTKLGYTEFRDQCYRRFAEVLNAVDADLEAERVAEERRARERKEAMARVEAMLQSNPEVSRAPKRVSFLPLVERVRIHAEKIKAERDRCCYIPRLSASYADARYNERPSDGEAVYRRLLECFISFKDPPTAFQHKLFTAVSSACAPLIFGEEFFSDPARCLQIIGGRFTDGIVGILTGRKTGKSTGLAYIAICLMFVIKRFKSIIVSKTLEQAKIILDTVKGLLQSHPWWSTGGYRVMESRATALTINGPDGSLRVLEARCGSGEVRLSPSLLHSPFFSLLLLLHYPGARRCAGITRECASGHPRTNSYASRNRKARISFFSVFFVSPFTHGAQFTQRGMRRRAYTLSACSGTTSAASSLRTRRRDRQKPTRWTQARAFRSAP